MSAVEAVTILRARGRRLAKIIDANGSITGCDEAKTFDLFERPVANLEALARLLGKLERRVDCCIVRCKPADPARCHGVRRLLYVDRQTGDLPTLVEVPRRWVALDFDHLPRPAWIDPADLLGCARVAIGTLPVEFQGAAFVAQATSSHALKPGSRVRLWTWLSRPFVGSELKYWLRKTPVDRSVFGAAQIVYTAAPLFLPGARDPLPSRIAIIPGAGSVRVPPRSSLKPRRKVPQPREGSPRSIAGLIRVIETAREGNRNGVLYWAACRIAEEDAGADAALDLEAAGVRAGLSRKEAEDTVRSALRSGGTVR
jgi:hypothetical protein